MKKQKNKWIKDVRRSDPTWNMNGKIGNNHESDNAHKLEVRHHINGSGPTAFGGAYQWPVVKAQVSFQTGEEDKANAFAEKLRIFIYQELNK
jgi:hypothetical protein